MRRVWLAREDFGLFHQDISPLEFEFYRSHAGAFKRMWHEQGRRFWSLFVSAFEHFIWNNGIMRDFPMTEVESREYVDEIMGYVREHFVEGRFTTAKALLLDCVVVAQNRNCIILLEKANYSQSPFVMKETREVFRQLFGPPTNKKTFMKVLCGLPVYVKFAGAAVVCLRRWMSADTIPSDEKMEAEFLANIHRRASCESAVIGQREELLRVVGRLQPPTSSSAKPKMSLKSIRLKTSDSDRPGGEGEGVVKDREEAAKKKRRKKKKSGESVEEGREGGEKEGAGKGERETLKDRAKSEQLDVTTTAAPEVAKREKVESEGAASGGSSPSSAADSGIGSGVEHVAVETPARQAGIDKSGGDTPPVVGERETRRRKLHTCACCGVGETTAKTFKRCQKCRGLPNPNYYCSRDCQAKHWKEHKLDHKDEERDGEKDAPSANTH